MSMYSPLVSSTSSHARGPRPLSITWVRPPSRFRSRNSEPGIELLQLVLGRGLDVVVERVALGVDADGERAEVLDAELPQALRHQFLPGDLLDLLDLGRLDRLVREAALAADRADAVPLAERLREAHHPRARRGTDADRLVLVSDLAH